jgi:hypothetical protein
MRKYLVDLTNDLIRKNGFEEYMARLLSGWSIALVSNSDFVALAAQELEVGAVGEMTGKKLAQIVDSFELGDVHTTKEEIFKHVRFSGDCKDLLRQQVAFFLACIIRDRLSPTADSVRFVPPFKK